jgi:lipoprotein-anchoring transpeptidase ErfK/SrfK
MSRKLLSALFCLLLAFTSAPATFAAVPQNQDQVLVLKKKKLLAQQQATKRKQAQQVAALDRKKATLAADEARVKAAQDQVARLEARRQAPRYGCGSFLQCLFGKRHNAQNAPVGALGSGLSGRSMREVVSWDDPKYKPGTLIVRTPERALYYVLGDGEAIRYAIGVGREGFQWGGKSKIVAKQEWPAWHPPAEMIRREAAKGHMLPDMMEGGPGNPLGARAMYIGGTIYRVHGTNNEASIGGAVSSGCIRMMNADVIDLYNRVRIGSPIYVYQ